METKEQKSKLIVMKFGGTSVGNSDRITDVAKIVADAQKKDQVVVVVSAMTKVTNLLVDTATSAAEKNRSQLDKNLAILRTIHKDAAVGLQLEKTAEEELLLVIDDRLMQLESILQSIYALGEL